MKRIVRDSEATISVRDVDGQHDITIMVNESGSLGILTNTDKGWCFISLFEPSMYWGHMRETAKGVIQHYLDSSLDYKIYQFESAKEFVEFLGTTV